LKAKSSGPNFQIKHHAIQEFNDEFEKILFALSKNHFLEGAPLRDPQHSRNCGAAHLASLIVIEAAWGWPA
jgi:hypothetical protein